MNNKPIQNPLLPSKRGYVEVIDENGNHVYTPTEETLENLQKEEKLQNYYTLSKQLRADIDYMSILTEVSL